jgi:hypothetical protein
MGVIISHVNDVNCVWCGVSTRHVMMSSGICINCNSLQDELREDGWLPIYNKEKYPKEWSDKTVWQKFKEYWRKKWYC